MKERTLQQLNRLSMNSASISDLHSGALALALCRYVNLTEIPNDTVALRNAINPLLDKLIMQIPLNVTTVILYAGQLHQYRHSVSRGYYPNASGSGACGDLSWLFGMNQFMSNGLMDVLKQSDFIAVYRVFCSVLADFAEAQ